MIEKAKKMLEADEGKKHSPYRCPAGFLTIGVGHNLDTNPLSDKVIDLILEEDIQETIKEARKIFLGFDLFSENRQLAIVNMIFNMGAAGFQGFNRAIHAIRAGDWEWAAREVRDSLYARQLPARSERVAILLEDKDGK